MCFQTKRKIYKEIWLLIASASSTEEKKNKSPVSNALAKRRGKSTSSLFTLGFLLSTHSSQVKQIYLFKIAAYPFQRWTGQGRQSRSKLKKKVNQYLIVKYESLYRKKDHHHRHQSLTEPFCEPFWLIVMLNSDGACVEKDEDDYKPEPGRGLRKRS